MNADRQPVHTQYLTFYIANVEYAINILKVKEIIEYDTVTKVPKMPACICGVINLRGSVVPVADLAIKFGLPATTITKLTCIVIVEVEMQHERFILGVMADAVSQVIDLPAGDIAPPPAFGAQIRVDYLLGMGKLGNKFLLILDIDKLLSTDELLASAPELEEKSEAVEAGPAPSEPQPAGL